MDTLKPLNDVTQPDSRWQFFGGHEGGNWTPCSLDQRHADAAALTLNATVPESIRVQFEVAKNLWLYAWFVYRFIPVAELHGYSTLEMALRERATREGKIPTYDIKGKERILKFSELIKIAIRETWITDSGFEMAQRSRERGTETRQMLMSIGAELPEEPPEDEDVQRYCKVLEDCLPKLRNYLAHGSDMVHPGGFDTLSICRDGINQLFPTGTHTARASHAFG